MPEYQVWCDWYSEADCEMYSQLITIVSDAEEATTIMEGWQSTYPETHNFYIKPVE